MDIRTYLDNNYKDFKSKFRGLCIHRLYNRNISIDDLYSDTILKIIETCDKGKKNFKTDTDCYNYISVSLINAVHWKWKCKKKIINVELEDIPEEIEDRRIKIENDNMVIEMEKWMKDNLNMFEEGLLKMWYINDLTYEEMSKISGFDKTHIFKTVKTAKQKLIKKFNDSKRRSDSN